MKHIFLHTWKQRTLSWGLIGLGLLLMLLAPTGREPIWVPVLIAGAIVEVIGIAMRHQERRRGEDKAQQ